MTSYQKRLQEIKALKERVHKLEALLPPETYNWNPLSRSDFKRGTIDNAQVDGTQPYFYGGKRGGSMADSWQSRSFKEIWSRVKKHLGN